MPTHCCVPQCTKKGYRDDDGCKVSYFHFPSDTNLYKKWIHAIRRDEGQDFQIKQSTKICSRHFRESEYRKTLTGRVHLKADAVPSLFPWIRTSPRKRKSPTLREISPKSLKDDFEEIEEEQSILDCSEDCTAVDIAENLPQIKDFGSQTVCESTCETCENTTELEAEKASLRSKLQITERQNQQLLNQLFTLERFKDDDSSISFYTGFQSYGSFLAIFNYINPGERGENINYWLSSLPSVGADYYDTEKSPETKRGRWRTLKPVNEFFLVMCRLRQGFAETHLGNLFQVSQPTVSRIFITWIIFLYLKLGQINIWPSRKVIDSTMPEDFKKSYSSTRVIIDCTEVRCEMPSSLHLNGELFSSYKHHTTLKGLIGISPGGSITFVSQLYTGSISDKEIVIKSGLLDLPFVESDSVMADKGFTIQDLLPLGVSLNIPPFLGSSAQMPAGEVVLTQQIASLRIHVERAINKVKNFHIWDGVIPLSLFGVVNQMWAVCAFLCNVQPNIISV